MNEWVWSNGGMILTGENWSAGRKTLYSVGGRWMNEYGAVVERYWQRKTEVLGEKHYTAWVVDEWMSMEQWWKDTDRGKLKFWEKDLSVSVLLCPPQISRDLSWNRTRFTALRGRRLTAHVGNFSWHFSTLQFVCYQSKGYFCMKYRDTNSQNFKRNWTTNTTLIWQAVQKFLRMRPACLAIKNNNCDLAMCTFSPSFHGHN